MKEPESSVFRFEAVRRYRQSRQESVSPRFAKPPKVLVLWLVLGFLLASGCLVLIAKVPVYASGPATVVDWHNKTDSIYRDIYMVAFLPTENLSRLRVGQPLFLRFEGTRLRRSILAVEPEIHSPERVQKRFGLGVGAALAITQPSAVAIARFEPTPTSLPVSTYVGCVYHVDIEIGSRRVISLLP